LIHFYKRLLGKLGHRDRIARDLTANPEFGPVG